MVGAGQSWKRDDAEAVRASRERWYDLYSRHVNRLSCGRCPCVRRIPCVELIEQV
ncbi:hypothetical protein CPB85DRAFT_1318607 [Mucidula mucida]|nr:hypothetical protein CPB85DRAFT_1334238 [Mucidula mucida]KAF8904187.1 hypothetical protein CPB85DRAFT_1318607 [Mucidula mucida]